MTIDEHTRHQLYLRLEQILGPEEAATLMEHLPPVGWADVATKHDLANLEQRMDLRFAATKHDLANLEQRMDLRFTATDARIDALGANLRAEFQRDLRLQGWAVFGGLSAMMAVFTALGRL